jgi:hypothetical protein
MNQTNYLKNIRLTRIVSRRDVIAGGVGSLIAIASTSLNQASAQSRQPNDFKPMDFKMQRFIDRTEIIDAINAVAFFADRKDWATVRRQFADEVDMDYTSLAGGQPVRVKANDLMQGWEKGLAPLKATQHLITNHQVTIQGDEAESLSSFHAWHYLPNDEGAPMWHLYGYYNHKLIRTEDGWKITAMKLTKTSSEGNFSLSGLASRAGVTNNNQ